MWRRLEEVWRRWIRCGGGWRKWGKWGKWGIPELAGLNTEELAKRGLTRMNDGSYMTVTLVEGGGFNMRPYTPSQALQVSVGSSRSDPRLLTPMDELGDELVKELKINAMAILKKVSLNARAQDEPFLGTTNPRRRRYLIQ